ncbi:HlyC/CorC family transporter [bacterium AH-315-E10]|nr:HlyC/CorC family transporter [bacterium AH-315-E10]
MLMEDHHRTLVTILIGTNVVNILASIVFNRMKYEWLIEVGLTDSAILMSPIFSAVLITIILLVFGEVSPKSIAFNTNEQLAPRVAPIIYVLGNALSPVIRFMKYTSAVLLKKLGREAGTTAISVEEFQTYVSHGQNMKVFDDNEVNLLNKIFELRLIKTSSIMVPRVDMKTVDINWHPDQVIDVLQKHCHRKVPVIDGELDKLVGILDVKRFMMLDKNARPHWVKSCCQKPLFMPEFTNVNSTLSSLRETKKTISILVDEYGGIAGLITVEDILEEVVGELSDEFDEPTWEMTKISHNHWRLSGLIPFHDIPKEIAEYLPESKADILSGFIAEQLGHIPNPGDEVKLKVCTFQVLKVEMHRVLEVDCRIAEDDAPC